MYTDQGHQVLPLAASVEAALQPWRPTVEGCRQYLEDDQGVLQHYVEPLVTVSYLGFIGKEGVDYIFVARVKQ